MYKPNDIYEAVLAVKSAAQPEETPTADAYLAGFVTKCAEYGVDPETLVKWAIPAPGVLKAHLRVGWANLMERLGGKLGAQNADEAKGLVDATWKGTDRANMRAALDEHLAGQAGAATAEAQRVQSLQEGFGAYAGEPAAQAAQTEALSALAGKPSRMRDFLRAYKLPLAGGGAGLAGAGVGYGLGTLGEQAE
jgi:hypothetical protein